MNTSDKLRIFEMTWRAVLGYYDCRNVALMSEKRAKKSTFFYVL